MLMLLWLLWLQSYQLLNCDDHANYLMKHKKDPALYRPDITHQVRSSSSSSGSSTASKGCSCGCSSSCSSNTAGTKETPRDAYAAQFKDRALHSSKSCY
jgi:hypothetical protein